MPDRGSLKIALAQVNPTVGALDDNAAMIADMIDRASSAGADLVLFPELVLSGYPPDDLLFRLDFLERARDALENLADQVADTVALVGFPEHAVEIQTAPNPLTTPLSPIASNSVAVLRDGEVSEIYRKQLLPNYGVFDERRHFEPGNSPLVIDVAGVRVGITICEDIWIENGPAPASVAAGAEMIANCSASPYARGKFAAREEIVSSRATECGVPVAMCNLIGAQDELVFDGGSMVFAPDGKIISRSPQFVEDLALAEVAPTREQVAGEIAPLESDLDQVYAALGLGLRDYVQKNGFERVVLGLSGGVDSAFVAVLAADALGPEAVTCVVMPSPHSSEETQADARKLAEALGCELIEIEIESVMQAYSEMLEPLFADTQPGLAEENLQARIRGNLVMALSNKFGWLPLATGNKSEMAVGYATLYGDMAGGFAPIKDVPKTLVYELIASRGERGACAGLPRSIVERAPSAELRPDQLDSDSLPDYEALDAVLSLYVDQDRGLEEIIGEGYDAAMVSEVLRMVDRAEYKRRQAPPGTRISSKAFGRDRRLPVTNRYGSLDPLPR